MASSEHAHGDGAEHEAASFLGEIRHRLIHLPSMSRPLKLITGLAIAQVVAAAVLISLEAVQGIGGHFPPVSLYVLDNQLVSTTVPVLVVSLVVLALAWGYLLAGLAHAHPAVQLAGLAVFTWLTFSGWDNLAIGNGSLAVTAVLVAVIWLVGGATHALHRRARRRHPGGAGSPVAVGVSCVVTAALVGGLYLNSYLAARAEGAPLIFTGQLSVEMASLAVLLVPLLLMAGADFAELADLFGSRVGAFTGRRLGVRILFGVATAAVLAVVADQLVHFRNHLDVIGVDVGIGVLAFAAIAGLLRLARVGARPRLHHVPQGSVVLVAVVSYGLAYALILAAQSATASTSPPPAIGYGPYTVSGPPAFHLEKPASWETADMTQPGGLASVRLDGLGQGDPAIVTIAAYSPAALQPDDAVTDTLLGFTSPTGLWKGQTAYLDGGHTEGSMYVYDVHSVPIFGGAAYHARAWTGTLRGDTLLIFALTPAADWSFNSPIFDHIAASLGPGTTTPATQPPATTSSARAAISAYERPEVITLGALLGIALITLVVTRLGVGRRFAGRLTTAAIFTTTVAVLAIAALPNYVLDVITNTPGHDVTPFHIGGIQTLVGILSLAWLARVAWRRGVDRMVGPLRLVLTLTIGLQVISWLYDLYTQSIGVQNFSVAQAVILLLAFLVDIALSGEGTTNRDGLLFPRTARVHLYFAYVLFTVTVILYFTTLRFQASGGAVESQFESDQYPQTGLIQLGVPLLLTAFVLGVMRWRAGRAAPEPAPVEAARQPAEAAAPS